MSLDCLGTSKGEAFTFEFSEASSKQRVFCRGMVLNLGKCSSRTGKYNITSTVSPSDDSFSFAEESVPVSLHLGDVPSCCFPPHGLDGTPLMDQGSLYWLYSSEASQATHPDVSVLVRCWAESCQSFTCLFQLFHKWEKSYFFTISPQIYICVYFSDLLKRVVDREYQYVQNYP